jgi:phosphate transport system substrate-binding protein
MQSGDVPAGSRNALTGRRPRRHVVTLAAALSIALVAASCADGGKTNTASEGGSELSGTIRIDGSSTVAPLSESAAELFREENGGVQVTVGTSGTGAGFKKFCSGETDISDASRPIGETEIPVCQQNGIAYDSFQVANDGIAIVVNKSNNWVDCLTVDQLKKMWDQGSTVKSWKEIDPKFPDEKLVLFGAGTDSGTFDFFTKAINGKEKQSRSDYNATEDDNVTVQGVSGTKGGLGYFGLSYYEQNQDMLKALKVNGGDGCVTPTTDTVQDGTYKPLSRPLFIYPSAKALQRPEVLAFVEFYIGNTDDITKQALFVPLTTEQHEKLDDQLNQLKAQG